jgi:NAD(P)-dependent dehydrogenase (short-subunit alcohol dehydrogenase family)
MPELDGRVALITGGGRGLGEAISRRLSASGATAIVADVRQDLASSVANSIRESGGCAEAVSLDVTDHDAATATAMNVAHRYGRLDVLVNNAGVDITLPVEELTVQEWDRVLAVNLRGPFSMSKAVLPHMKKQGSGHVINITSTAARRTWPNASVYHASKYGLLGFSHALWTELREYGIKVTAVVAGGMRTPFLLDRFPDIDPKVLQDPAAVAETVRFVLCQPPETVIPEVMVIPTKETSWP